MGRYYQAAKRIILENREFLDKLAAALTEKKVLIGREVQAIKATCKIVA